MQPTGLIDITNLANQLDRKTWPQFLFRFVAVLLVFFAGAALSVASGLTDQANENQKNLAPFAYGSMLLIVCYLPIYLYRAFVKLTLGGRMLAGEMIFNLIRKGSGGVFLDSAIPGHGASLREILRTLDDQFPDDKQGASYYGRGNARTTAGTIVLFLLVFFIVPYFVILNGLNNTTPVGARSDAVWFVGTIAYSLLFLAGWLRYTGLQMDQRSARELIAADPRPPVLFLRAFKDGSLRLRSGKSIYPSIAPVISDSFVAQILHRVGPVVAIGDPVRPG
jgi:hypothetical protein